MGNRKARRNSYVVRLGIHPQREDDPTCETKRRYPDQPTALARAAHYFESREVDARKLYAYRCRACLGWHLTHNQRLNRGAMYASPEGIGQ